MSEKTKRKKKKKLKAQLDQNTISKIHWLAQKYVFKKYIFKNSMK